MSSIFVDGLGQVDIKGTTPTEEENKAIIEALQLNNKSINEELAPQPVGLEKIGGRPVFEAAGSMVGAVPGLAGGLPGAVATGVGGAMAGGQVYDILQGYVTDQERDLGTQANALKKDLSREALLQTIFSKIPGAFQATKRFVFGDKTQKGRQLYQNAKNLKDADGNSFPLSLSDGGNAISRAYGRVAGVFPFVGTPIKTSTASKANTLNNQADTILNELAPNVHLTDLGIDMVDAAKQTYGEWKNVTRFLYDDFYKYVNANARKPIVSTVNMKSSAQSYIDLIEAGTVKLKSGKKIKSPRKDPVYNYVRSLLDASDNITINEYRGIVRDIATFARKSEKEGFDLKVLTGIKKGLEKDLNLLTNDKYLKDLKIDPEIAKNIVSKLKFSNKVFSEGIQNTLIKNYSRKKVTVPGIKKFDSPTAKKFKTVDKNIFGAGAERQGSVTADELGEKLLRSSSFTPQMLDDFKVLVGEGNYNKFVRNIFQKSYNKSLYRTNDKMGNGLIFDPSEFKSQLGLNTKDGRAVMERMLSGSKLTLSKLDEFFDVAENHASLRVPDVSSFIQRRALLGGTKSVFGGLAMGYSTMNSPVRSIGLVALSRFGISKFFTNPKQLDDVMNTIDLNASYVKTYRSSLRLIAALLEDETLSDPERLGIQEYKEYIEENKDEILKGNF